MARVAGDLHLAMAIAITLTLALPPLVWFHYYILALIPSLWLLNLPSTRPSLRWCGLAALVLSAGLPAGLFLLLGWNTSGHVSGALSWLVLWLGILLRLSESGVSPAPLEPQARPARRIPARDVPSRQGSRSAVRR
jgi:hypothetical protein